MDTPGLLRRYRKLPLANPDELSSRSSFTLLDCGREEIERIIPHREPFLLVDRLTGLDMTQGEETLFGERRIAEDDPVFRGHFPDRPLYPGVLQLEMGGQLGLCLSYFVTNGRASVAGDARPVPVMASKVLGALFTAPVTPGTLVTLRARGLVLDGLAGRVISQVSVEDRICCVAVSEVVFL